MSASPGTLQQKSDWNYLDWSIELTEERWKQLMRCLRYGPQAIQGLLEMERFQSDMDEIHQLAGHSQEQLQEISQAILDMAQMEEDEH